MTDLPSGTVTLVFTDIEGSTRLLADLGVHAYREALSEHREQIGDALTRERRRQRTDESHRHEGGDS